MILSIGMIVKNEEKYLRKCLESLAPILSELNSELIIADTGSADNTLAISKEFTNNVFCIEWINDFSAARNSTIEKASGDWYMFIDGDEILENTEELISFFKSGEYKKYNCATYIQRNYANEDMTVYSDFNAGRLIKLAKNTRFIGAIHERLNTFGEPIKILSTVANHFGYIFSDKNLSDAKSKRNSEILLKEIEKNPQSAILHHYLLETYNIGKNYEEALKHYHSGLKCAKAENNINLMYAFYANAALIYSNLNKPKEALGVIEEYFKSKNAKITLDVEMYALKGSIYSDLMDYKHSVEAFEMYVQLYFQYHNSLNHTKETLFHPIQFISKNAFQTIVYMAVSACINMEDYSSAYKWLDRIPFKEYNGDENDIYKRIKIEFNIMNSLNDYTNAVVLYEHAHENAKIKLQNFINELLIQQNRDNLALLNAFTKSSLDDTYVELLRIKYSDVMESSKVVEKIENLIPRIEKWDNTHSELIYFMIKYNFTLTQLMITSDAFDLDSKIKYILKRYSDLPDMILKYLNTSPEIKDRKEQLWLAMLCESIIPFSGSLQKEQSMYLFRVFAVYIYEYLNEFYKQAILTEEGASLLPRQLRFGYYSYLALAALEDNNNSLYVHNLELAYEAYPEMQVFIKTLRSEALDSEMDAYARAIKSNIIKFIQQGQFDYAKQTLAAYEQINPNDSEISYLKKQISSGK